MVEALIRAGVEVFRLNFSHGSHDFHRTTFNAIRLAADKLGESVVILQDISGPKLRIGEFEGGKTQVANGAQFQFVRNLKMGSVQGVGFEDSGWFKSVEPGHRVILGDGQIGMRVLAKGTAELICNVEAGGLIRSKWGLNFPDSNLELGAITDKDREDIRFGLLLGVDVMALSFVKSADDIREARRMMEGHAAAPLIIAKIERRQAVERIGEILEEADGLMVARGDLGIDLPMEKIPTVQKLLIALCRKNGKAVITATQMLESMTTSPRPTRAEVTDVANAVYDGTDAVMLSGETAVGANPPLVVETMAQILREAEMHAKPPALPQLEESVEEAVVDAVTVLVRDLDAAIVMVPFTSGTTAARISRRRLGVPVVAGAKTAAAARRMRLYSGVFPFLSPSQTSWLANIAAALDLAKARGWVREGDVAVATGGFPLGRVGVTNFVRAIRVGEEL